jgi:hypothetical protein
MLNALKAHAQEFNYKKNIYSMCIFPFGCKYVSFRRSRQSDIQLKYTLQRVFSENPHFEIFNLNCSVFYYTYSVNRRRHFVTGTQLPYFINLYNKKMPLKIEKKTL